MSECVICGEEELGRRFGGNHLCPDHWNELLEEEPETPLTWINERRGGSL